MRICLFGGTFDPLHIGHEKLIVTLLEKFDKVIVIPVKKSPEKNSPSKRGRRSNQKKATLTLN